MTDITKLTVKFHTADIDGAGTDGDVYLEIGGREFHIDSKKDDYETGVDRTYGLGGGLGGGEIPVNSPEHNDPRKPYPLTDENIDDNPVWVRFEPENDDDHWICQYVSVKAKHASTIVRFYEALEPEDDTKVYLMFGHRSGKFLFLHRNRRGEGEPHD
jgi:hypothetical protein